jgi:PAS domain-containing protein
MKCSPNRSTTPTDLVKITDCSYDAALLIDMKGRVRYANEMTEILLGISEHTKSYYIDAWMVFTATNKAFPRDLSWKDIMKELSSLREVSEWQVKCTNQSNECVFSAWIRITALNWKDGHTYFIAYLKGYDKDFRSKRSNRQFEMSTDPMMAIDQMGNILMFNQAAVDTIHWCEPEIVGQHISHALKGRSFDVQPDPIIGVDKRGIIVSVNDAATDSLPWCNQDLIGENLLHLGIDHTGDKMNEDSTETGIDTYNFISSWLSTKKIHDEIPRKKSPEVLFVFISGKQHFYDCGRWTCRKS